MEVKSPQNWPQRTVLAGRLLAETFLFDSAALCRHVLQLQRQLCQGSCHNGSRTDMQCWLHSSVNNRGVQADYLTATADR